ncbi:MAG: proline dehydrogenase family protein [Bacteroidia bacterium]
MLSFSNTEIAFKEKSDQELRRAFLLFKFISYPVLLKIGKPLLNFALWLHLPVERIIKATVFSHFCGGENLIETENTIKRLARNKVKGIPDYSVEGKESDADFEHVTDELIKIIGFVKGNSNTPFAVFKPTGIARFGLLEKVNSKAKLTPQEEAEYKKVIERFDRICRAAHDAAIFVMVDAEETWIQDAIDEITEEMMKKYNREKAVVFNTLQLYRHDRLAFLKATVEKAKGENWFPAFKLVRGAYMEKERERAEKKGYPSPIHKNKAAVDNDYDSALDYCLDNFPFVSVFAGTHNEESSLHLVKKMTDKKIEKSDQKIYFSQLFGMSDNISFNLASEGYNVAKYIPYGPVRDVMPYLIRRAEENTSVAGQTGRELRLITSEIIRRKQRN